MDITEIALTDAERSEYKAWMQKAMTLTQNYNGSEVSYEQLCAPLLAMDTFIRSKNNGKPSIVMEQYFAQAAWPDNTTGLNDLNSFLESAGQAYRHKLRGAGDYKQVLALLEAGGAVVKHHAKTFVRTDDGELNAATKVNPAPLELKTQPRLAILLQRLRDEEIYTDDIIAHVCTPDKTMMRTLPYVVLHIPRLDKEIAVCDEVGEITFVANKSIGTDVWEHLSKDQLKARPEVTAVRFDNEEQWWNTIREVVIGDRDKSYPKVNIQVIACKKPPLDSELIKQSILAHYEATGTLPSQNSGPVAYGPYKDQAIWATLDGALRQGTRGLPGGSSLAALKRELAEENRLDYTRGRHTAKVINDRANKAQQGASPE